MAHQPIVVVMTIAVNAVPKPVHAAVVQIAPPKRDHRVVRVEMAAVNVAVVKLVAPVVVDQKVDLMLVPNVVDQAEGDVQPPALPARQGGAGAFQESVQAEVGGEFPGAGGGLDPGQAVEAALGDEFLANGDAGVDAAGLGDVAGPPPDARRVACQVASGDGRRARGGGQKRGEHPQGGALARAVGAE